MRAAARRIRGRWCPGEWCAGRDRGAARRRGRRREVVSPFGHSGAHMALNRHFRRHFVLVCARNSAISRSGLSPDENDPGERAGRSPARLGTGTAARITARQPHRRHRQAREDRSHQHDFRSDRGAEREAQQQLDRHPPWWTFGHGLPPLAGSKRAVARADARHYACAYARALQVWLRSSWPIRTASAARPRARRSGRSGYRPGRARNGRRHARGCRCRARRLGPRWRSIQR